MSSLAATLAVAALLAAGCGRSGSGETEESRGDGNPTKAAEAAPGGDFGDLKGVCGPGDAKSASAQGVTADTIKVGVFSDVGFTKKSEYGDTAKVFTSWCNAAGGINGRKLVATVRDSKLLEVRQRMIESCKEDFAIAGGGSAMDGLGTKERLSCLLPEFPAQTSMVQNNGSDLQVSQTGGSEYNRYAGYYNWLLKEAYPKSADAIGIISGDSPVSKVLGAQAEEGLKAAGGTIAYSDLYPASGVSDWTPYAQAIKSKKVRALVFYGDFTSLTKLEQVLTGMKYKLDWIDANSNAYGSAFLKLGGTALDYQNNLADLNGVHPLESASENPATQQLVDVFEKYAPDTEITLPGVRGFGAWLLFAKAAKSCGDDLTRTCVYEAARKESAWTAGGLLAPVNLTDAGIPVDCFNVEKATSKGWEPADFKPDKGAYRCDVEQYKYTGDYGKPLTLADVGKSMDDVK
ncbi:ABC transporter substrate-binding protein [Streptomyces sp. PSKA54]|uniref:ABC transporter substrate-binding protein n=1 Tax=Streptomyces himalayensis subsp. aureolus TaxID=2758039 RepID=A0A7W2D2D7_9ACTN|nr:ABC transporter substrate-binding protein [Streptomyces himalayensis]MBA4863532.1 ABC transporter substrate-binding protein [Streptomyces himalayensis subsp. aureolus]